MKFIGQWLYLSVGQSMMCVCVCVCPSERTHLSGFWISHLPKLDTEGKTLKY